MYPSSFQFPFRPGDRVTLVDHPGCVGVVQIVTSNEVWLDVSPGVLGYECVLAHFPQSWHPDGVMLHAINRLPFSKVRTIEGED